MCIRDSCQGALRGLGQRVPGAHEASELLADRSVIGVGRKPVSYTHLRAHETVLDLVCRLLLETKNTRVPTHKIV